MPDYVANKTYENLVGLSPAYIIEVIFEYKDHLGSLYIIT